ncbi:MAG: hypothetical protein E7214_02420 [Clostridium sp.]|nr:hypothetical protein [Clostridium sp.]
MRKKEGTFLVAATVIFSITTILILITYVVTLNIIRDEAEMASDDLVSSELAVYKDIDMPAMGKSGKLNLIKISKYEDAFKTFKRFLKNNFNLDENLTALNKANFIKGKLKIESFIIYNVIDDDVEKIEYKDGKFSTTKETNGRNGVVTPKGNLVENTTVYAKVSFDINTMFKKKKKVELEEETDILKEQ